jgi:hypothetical protein
MKKLFAVLLLSASMMFAQHGGGHQGGGFHGNAPTPRPEYRGEQREYRGEQREYRGEQREYRGEQREYHSGWHRFGEPGHREFRPFYGGVRIFSTPICPPRVFVYVGPPVGYYSPGPNYVWVAGHYDWDGYQYVWVDGQWVLTPFYGAVWVNPVYVGGYFHCGFWRR